MKKTRVQRQVDHQPAASQAQNDRAQQKDVSVTLEKNSTAQAKRVESLQDNPAQLALQRKSMALQEKSAASTTQEGLESVQRVEDEELQGKFDTTQRMEEEELQGKFDTTQLMEEEELQGKFDTTQLMEEEELQGKFDTAQRVEEEELQGKFDTTQLAEEEELQGKFDTAQKAGAEKGEPSQDRANNTGLPDNLKAGVESMSGMSLDGVQVHYNSDKPAQLNASAFAQGKQIHVGPGQEKHLPHETWHVVQQAEGRVKPTMKASDGTKINNDAGLEKEADVMGAKAAQFKPAEASNKSKS